MTKQEIARKRNFAKFRLMGITTREIREGSNETEKVLLKEIEDKLKQLKDNWDENSKSLGLKVVRCWCGRHVSTKSKNKRNLGDRICWLHEHSSPEEKL